MLIASNNLTKFLSLPEDVVIRINLAWYFSLEELEKNICNLNHLIFIDYPSGRTKPPTNKHSNEDIKYLVDKYNKIKYLAISNVENYECLQSFVDIFPSLIVVPKIETIKGVINIASILSSLPYKEKIIMLDHEDLYNDLVRNNIPVSELYTKYVASLDEHCKLQNAKMLRTTGIVFND